MTNKKICYLCDNITSIENSSGDHLLIQELQSHNISVEKVDWQQPNTSWKEFDLVLIRTTWNYMHFSEDFKTCLKTIASQTKLVNPLETVLWNMNKKYLLELKDLGIPIIPTKISSHISLETIQEAFATIDQGEGIIVKPTIGAGSAGIQYLKSATEFQTISEGEWFIQPFQSSVQTQGEYSLFYFGGKYSHAINKLPKQGDFRSQEEFDSTIKTITADEKMKKLGDKIFQELKYSCEYARVDILFDKANNPMVIELELIEPSLYLNFSQDGHKIFTTHLLKLLEE